MSDRASAPSVGPTTLVQLLHRRATEAGSRRAFTFLVDGEREEQSVTYAELAAKAQAIAANLSRSGVAPGERALLLYPPGIDYIAGFFGCLYAGVIAVPA